MEKQSNSSLEIQVGGAHYKNMKMQPIELIAKLNLNFFQGNFVKYISRYKNKNGKQDLEKCLHYIDLKKDFGIGFLEPEEIPCILDCLDNYCSLNNFSMHIKYAILMYLLNRYDEATHLVESLIKKEYGTEQ